MKKWIAIILALTFLMLSAVCFAEEERFFAGVYHVGRDFKPGSYNIRVTKTSNREPWCFIDIYKDEASFSNNEEMIARNFSVEGYHLSVEDGMVFSIEVYDCTLSIVNETMSWMITDK